MEEEYLLRKYNFYNQLETLANCRKSCEIIFIKHEGKSIIRGKIENLYIKEGIGFLKMFSGIEIRLDAIIQVDGKIPPNLC